jgi:hypothetical protein
VKTRFPASVLLAVVLGVIGACGQQELDLPSTASVDLEATVVARVQATVEAGAATESGGVELAEETSTLSPEAVDDDSPETAEEAEVQVVGEEPVETAVPDLPHESEDPKVEAVDEDTPVSLEEMAEHDESDDSPVAEEVVQQEIECGEPTIFEFPPVNLDKTAVVLPLGLMSGNHVTPIDHQYFQDFDNQEVDIEVYAPGDGVIKSLQHMFGSYFGPENELIEWSDFRLVIDHGCGVESIYIHIGQLSDKVAAQAPDKGDYSSVRISVEAGEIIGWYSQNVDYNLVDQDVVLSGLLVTEHYESEPWKIHVPHTLDYFSDEIRDQIAAKSLRTAEPIGGKFDHDVDGRLIGNWFLEGTNGYGGVDKNNVLGTGYWIGHLSISPDFLDPSHFIVSIGNYEGEPKQFGVKGNSPFPLEVTVDSGMIEYELVGVEYYAGEERWDGRSLVKDIRVESKGPVQGVILVQLIEDRRLRVEVFPGETGEEVHGFSENAKVYER